MELALLGLFAGLVGLYFGGDWLVTGASRIARSLGISALIVGLTIVSIGTSTPELLVSVSAALSGSTDISIGNIIGSNIANIGLILGISGLVYPVSVHTNLLRREVPIMLFVASVAYLLLRDGTISRLDGGILVAGMIGFIGFMIVSSQQEDNTDVISDEDSTGTPPPRQINRWFEMGRMILGIGTLMIGAQLTVTNATAIARTFGISELIIGVTLVAIGTSLPELVTSVMAALKQESDIAIGNVVGSNIFNLLGILGITGVISPIAVTSQIIQFDALVMLALSVLVIPFALDRQLGRLESIGFILAYATYVSYVILSA